MAVSEMFGELCPVIVPTKSAIYVWGYNQRGQTGRAHKDQNFRSKSKTTHPNTCRRSRIREPLRNREKKLATKSSESAHKTSDLFLINYGWTIKLSAIVWRI